MISGGDGIPSAGEHGGDAGGICGGEEFGGWEWGFVGFEEVEVKR